MSKDEICQELIWNGMGEMTTPTAATREFEAYGSRKPTDDEHIAEMLEEYGHDAPC